MVPTCAIFMIFLAGPLVQHPGKAVWNVDGSWSVDWPAMEEAAASEATTTSPERMVGEGWAALGTTNFMPRQIARALLAARDAGKLLESPLSHHPCN